VKTISANKVTLVDQHVSLNEEKNEEKNWKRSGRTWEKQLGEAALNKNVEGHQFLSSFTHYCVMHSSLP
jgi:hypothetical protein